MGAVLLLLLLAVRIGIPPGLDQYLPVPEDNPLTPERIARGRELFFDRRLSRDGTIACASCHVPERAFSDGRPTPIGVFNRPGRRNAPALINRGYGRAFFWDGRATTLEEQVLMPIVDPNELAMTLEEASARVSLPVDEISRSLASFVRSLLSGDSQFDRFVSGDRTALTPVQQVGLQVFRGKGHCTACHIGPTFTDETFHNTGVAWRGGRLLDDGRFAVSLRTADRGAFKTPTLRDVAKTAPYMHDGSLATLPEVIDFYDRGGSANPALDPEIRRLNLTPTEKRALTAFLESLNGSASDSRWLSSISAGLLSPTVTYSSPCASGCVPLRGGVGSAVLPADTPVVGSMAPRP